MEHIKLVNSTAIGDSIFYTFRDKNTCLEQTHMLPLDIKTRPDKEQFINNLYDEVVKEFKNVRKLLNRE